MSLGVVVLRCHRIRTKLISQHTYEGVMLHELSHVSIMRSLQLALLLHSPFRLSLSTLVYVLRSQRQLLNIVCSVSASSLCTLSTRS